MSTSETISETPETSALPAEVESTPNPPSPVVAEVSANPNLVEESSPNSDVPDRPEDQAVEPQPAKLAEARPRSEQIDPIPPRDLNLPDTPQMRRICRLQVPIIVRLANRVMPLGEILQLAPGAIIEFNKSVNESLDLMINNKYVGGGQAVKVSEKFGLKITHLTTIDQRIRALGPR